MAAGNEPKRSSGGNSPVQVVESTGTRPVELEDGLTYELAKDYIRPTPTGRPSKCREAQYRAGERFRFQWGGLYPLNWIRNRNRPVGGKEPWFPAFRALLRRPATDVPSLLSDFRVN